MFKKLGGSAEIFNLNHFNHFWIQGGGFRDKKAVAWPFQDTRVTAIAFLPSQRAQVPGAAQPFEHSIRTAKAKANCFILVWVNLNLVLSQFPSPGLPEKMPPSNWRHARRHFFARCLCAVRVPLLASGLALS